MSFVFQPISVTGNGDYVVPETILGGSTTIHISGDVTPSDIGTGVIITPLISPSGVDDVRKVPILKQDRATAETITAAGCVLLKPLAPGQKLTFSVSGFNAKNFQIRGF